MSALPAFLRPGKNGVEVLIKVIPRASRNQISEVLGDRLKIKITAPPVDSAANNELISFLAKRIGCPRKSLRITRGQTSRNKTVHVESTAIMELAASLVVE